MVEPWLNLFFPEGGWTVTEGDSGMNNTTRYVHKGGERFVLRIYGTHRDANKLEFEHRVLEKLAAADSLPFRTPAPVRTVSGDTIARPEPDGPLAALFRYIEGDRPRLESEEQLRAFGEAAGHLTAALAGLRLELEPAYRPYYEIEAVHPQCPLERVHAFCAEPPPPFVDLAGPLAGISKRLHRFTKQRQGLLRLPHQLVHGDLNGSNALASAPDAPYIRALLDFEFVTRDLRVMEPAVCVSDLLRPELPADIVWRQIGAFLDGYGQATILTLEEKRAIPLLVLLRRLDVVVHFLGRYLDGVEPEDVLRDQVRRSAEQLDWLDRHEAELLELIGRGSL